MKMPTPPPAPDTSAEDKLALQQEADVLEKSKYGRIAFLIGAGVLVALSAAVVSPFLPAILWAIVLAILMAPLYAKWVKSFQWAKGSAPTLASLSITLLTFFLICLPFILVGGLVATQLTAAVKQLESMSVSQIVDQLDKSVGPILQKVGVENFHLQETLDKNREEITRSIRGPVTKIATQAGFTLFTIVIALLSLFFFLRDGASLSEPARSVLGLPKSAWDRLLKRLHDTVHAVFVGTVLVAIVQGSIIGFTYAFLNVPNAALLGVVSIVLCIVPLLGAPVIYIPVGLVFLAQGKVKEAAIILGVGFLIVSQIDNVLKPWLIGSRANQHPMATFFFVLGGIALLGPIGLMIGPMILTTGLFFFEVFQEFRRLHSGFSAPIDHPQPIESPEPA